MVERRGNGDFTQAYRPCRLSEVVGNEEAKRLLDRAFKTGKVPHNFLFHGISGTGKTTLARIIMMGLNCVKGPTSEPCCECYSCERIIKRHSLFAVLELNAVEVKKDELREYLNNFDGSYAGAIEGLKKGIFLVDECHGLTDDQAGLFLKYTENVHEHDYYIFCTTEPKKVLKTLKNRCMKIPFAKVPDKSIQELLTEICTKENLQVDREIIKKIVGDSEGMPREAVTLLQKATIEGDIRERKIKPIPGNKNLLIIAPHGVIGDDDYTNILTEEIADRLGCYAVINDQYQKPLTVGKNAPDAGAGLLDLNLIDHAKMVPENGFLNSIEAFVAEMTKTHERAYILILHGIRDENMRKAAQKIAESKSLPKQDTPDILVGYGQFKDLKKQRLSADKKTVLSLIEALRSGEMVVEEAPTKPIDVDGEPKYYCGWDDDRLNQYFTNKGLPVQSIQLEIKKSGFRNDPDMARKAAERLATIFEKIGEGTAAPAELSKAPAALEDKKRFWSALTKKPEMREIRVSEIDLENTKFVLRTPELGIDQEKLNWLVSTIKAGGIHQNIIVRKTPGEGGFQLLSGFRRISALKKTLEEEGKGDEFENQKVWAEVYDNSLTDEEAYQVCLSENLAREEPSTWEMANFLLKIRQGLIDSGKKKGEATRHLEAITNMDRLKIGKLLRIGAIQNHEIQRDIHLGIIDFSVAAIFAREEFSEDDRVALHGFFKKHSMALREFDGCVRNLLELKKWSKQGVPKILALPGAKEILSFDSEALKERVESLRKAGKGKVLQILENHLEEIKRLMTNGTSRGDLAPFLEKFSKKAAFIEKKVNSLFADKKSGASFSIKPSEDFRPDFINLSISAPLNNATTALSLAAKEIKDDLSSLQAAFRYLPKKEKTDSKKASSNGAREWAVRSVNCCEGCGRDCLYCYGKYMAAMRKKGQIPLEKWKEETIRQDKVDKPYGLMKGRTMFPSSHDITTTNYDACLTVLRKLLNAGNDVVVVSKPNLEIVKKLCTELKDFKKQYLFRFTITATDDNILSFWEPNAPKYEERKASLKFAFEAGFRTSVSVEPMLDPARIEDLVDDLSPYVNDAIWIGKMNHLRRIRPDNDAMRQAIKKIEKGQSDENIFEIYETFKNNPKIKWKESIKKVLGIPLAEKAGMDV